MLNDGLLSSDEKKMIIKLASIMGIEGKEPLKIFEAVINNKTVEDEEHLVPKQQLELYQNMILSIIQDEKMSDDEISVIRYIAQILKITEIEHNQCMQRLKKDMDISTPNIKRLDILSSLAELGRFTTNLFNPQRRSIEQRAETE